MSERDFGYEAQRAAEAHLEACYEALYDEDGEEREDLPESPAVGPFCGCTTCEIREVLHAAWPILFEAVKAELEG